MARQPWETIPAPEGGSSGPRIVRGVVAVGDGTILAGSGFTAVVEDIVGVMQVTITYTTPFTVLPVLTYLANAGLVASDETHFVVNDPILDENINFVVVDTDT